MLLFLLHSTPHTHTISEDSRQHTSSKVHLHSEVPPQGYEKINMPHRVIVEQNTSKLTTRPGFSPKSGQTAANTLPGRSTGQFEHRLSSNSQRLVTCNGPLASLWRYFRINVEMRLSKSCFYTISPEDAMKPEPFSEASASITGDRRESSLLNIYCLDICGFIWVLVCISRENFEK